ncbi:hypothetical protein [Escherichia coli]|uniref:hypothetical protein n=1 Tax=Escherichia coli TaxID=562 RepID=UPI00287AC868|nr:hypothetical protein [Escherichia coli]MDS1619971.1 hypothetical protein [Escherichia coli]
MPGYCLFPDTKITDRQNQGRNFSRQVTAGWNDKAVQEIVRPRYFIRTPYNGVLASQTRHDYCPQSTMTRGGMSPGLVGRW